MSTLFNSLFGIGLWLGKGKKLIWNRGVKLQWDRLYIRRDEFHNSLNMDVLAMIDMSPEERDVYWEDLIKRRQIAHKRDF